MDNLKGQHILKNHNNTGNESSSCIPDGESLLFQREVAAGVVTFSKGGSCDDDFIKLQKKKRIYNDAFPNNEINIDGITVNFNYISSNETEINIEFNKQKKLSIIKN